MQYPQISSIMRLIEGMYSMQDELLRRERDSLDKLHSLESNVEAQVAKLTLQNQRYACCTYYRIMLGALLPVLPVATTTVLCSENL